MKKIILVLVILSFLLLIGCNIDPYDGERPFDYGDAEWVCEDPLAYFVIDADSEEYYSPRGEICLDDQLVEFQLIFVHGTDKVFLNVTSRDVSGELNGECVFSPEKLIIIVNKETDTLFYGKYDELIFTYQYKGDLES